MSLWVFMHHINHAVCPKDLMLKGKGTLCCFLLPCPEFAFNLWGILVCAAKFLGNREKSVMGTNPEYQLSSANPIPPSRRGRCFGEVLVSEKKDLHPSSLLNPMEKKEIKAPTLKYFILFCRTLADLSPGTINSCLSLLLLNSDVAHGESELCSSTAQRTRHK